MIVRDEIDIIKKNIFFHANQGFDYFAIMDNSSKDGTRELIEEISRDVPMKIFSKLETDYRQDIWATELAGYLSQIGIDFAISLDADEFIMPTKSTFREISSESKTPLILQRHNMLPAKSDLGRFMVAPFDATRYRVAKPLQTQLPIMLRRMPGKVFFPLRGLRSIARGNHGVEHEISERVTSEDALIRHFPVGRYSQFLTKLDHARERFRQECNVSPLVSWHIRRWLKLQDEGKIEEEYNSFFLSDEDLATHIANGTVKRDDFCEKVE